MIDSYVLEINCNKIQDLNIISSILGVEPNWDSPYWGLWYANKRIEGKDANHCSKTLNSGSYIENFLDLLEGKYEELKKVGIRRRDIVIWNYYKYNGECKRHYTPRELQRMGENKIPLCLTCWEGDDEA
jgi:hypothetical protein